MIWQVKNAWDVVIFESESYHEALDFYHMNNLKFGEGDKLYIDFKIVAF